MTLSIKDAGVWKTVQNLFTKDAGVWKEVNDAFVRDAGVHKRFHGFLLTVTGSPTNFFRFVLDPSNATVTLTANDTVTWSFVKISGADATLGGAGPSTSTTVTQNNVAQSVYDVTATHAATGQINTNRVTVEVDSGA